MGRYIKPYLKTFGIPEIQEAVGPVQMASATMNIYGGRTASLDSGHTAEYSVVKTEINYGIITQKEAAHA